MPIKKTTDSKKLKPNLRYQQDKDSQMVKGIFRNNEIEGGTLSFVYKAYKGQPVERYDFTDGETYTIPLGVAKHLNKNIWYPIHAYTMKENGTPVKQLGKKVHRCVFQSLEFLDMDEPVLEEIVEMQKTIQL